MIRLVATWEAFKVATNSLRANKLRTALTLVGIIVVTHEHDIAARAHRVVSIRDGLIEKDERIK